MAGKNNFLLSALRIAARVAIVAYAAVLILLWLQQRHFIYYPDQESYEQLEKTASAQSFSPWKDSHGNTIGWISKPSIGIPAYRCLVFQGNSGYALRRTYIARGMQAISEKGDWEIYLLEYPGYGARTGNPSEKNLVAAGLQAVDILKESDSRPIFIIGESLGTGVAAQVASLRPDIIAGMLLISPFDNMTSLAQNKFPVLPHRFFYRTFLKDRYESDVALRNYDGPIAFLYASNDPRKPRFSSEALYNSYHGPKKKWVEEDDDQSDVNFSPFADWWQEVFSFLTSKAVITKF